MGSLTRTIRYTDYVPPRFQILEPLVYTPNEPVALLDRLLVERFAGKITIGVRGEAIYNDVTRYDLIRSRYPQLPVIDTGDCTPGVALRRASAAFQQTMRQTDLVIAKGQGNYETLDRYDRPIIHLLRIKCPVIANLLGAPLGALQILVRNAEDL